MPIFQVPVTIAVKAKTAVDAVDEALELVGYAFEVSNDKDTFKSFSVDATRVEVDTTKTRRPRP